MACRIENVIFFAKKNELLICRGGRFTKVSITKEGNLIELTDYKGYSFCPKTGDLFSLKGKKITRVKKYYDGPQAFYFLYVNGLKSRVFSAEIFAKDGKKIQQIAENSRF